MTAVTVALLFLLALFLAPLAQTVPLYATAPALLFVACLMAASLGALSWDDPTDYIPALIIVLMMPLSYSIATGIGLGFIAYVALKALAGRAGEINAAVGVIAACLPAQADLRVSHDSAPFLISRAQRPGPLVTTTPPGYESRRPGSNGLSERAWIPKSPRNRRATAAICSPSSSPRSPPPSSWPAVSASSSRPASSLPPPGWAWERPSFGSAPPSTPPLTLWLAVWTFARSWHVERRLKAGLEVDEPKLSILANFRGS